MSIAALDTAVARHVAQSNTICGAAILPKIQLVGLFILHRNALVFGSIKFGVLC